MTISRVTRQIEIDVLEVVRARAPHPDLFCTGSRRCCGVRSSAASFAAQVVRIVRIKRATCYYNYKLIRGLVCGPMHLGCAAYITLGSGMTVPSQSRMTSLEIRASISLASIFALRLLGLFLILPVFAVYAQSLQGGTDPALVGVALGIYGLTQGVLQIPYGAASDRWGRKPVIAAGLVVFAAGSFIAALATDIVWTIVGRAIQGAGAISAAVTSVHRRQHP